MSGLFRRARAIRTRMELLGDLQTPDYIQDIPEAERERVLSGIDSMLLDDRHRIDADALRFIPKKRSFVLPLMLNAGAVIILGVGALVMMRIFDRGQTLLTKPDAGLDSAEGKILERLRQNAEAELAEKQKEINDIRALMADLEGQKSDLALQSESRLSEQEAELRRQFDAQLAAEKTRLTGTGISGENLNAAMAAYEVEVRNRLDESLNEVRTGAAREQERALSELENQRRSYEQQIGVLDVQQKGLQDELEARKAELIRLEERRRADSTEVTRQLDELRIKQQREKNITDQILAFYSRVGIARASGDGETALKTLDSLELFLSEDSIQLSPAVENRREIDAFLIGAIRRLIVLESVSSDPASAETAESPDSRSAAVLAELSAGAAAGNLLADGGNIAAAQAAWRDAFSAIPELQTAFDTALKSAGDSRDAATAAAAGAVAVTAADLAAARDQGLAEGFQRGSAASVKNSAVELENAREEGYSRGLAAGVNDGRKESAQALSDSDKEKSRLKALLADLSGKLSVLQNRYRQALVSTEDEIQGSRERLVELLDKKLIIKSGLDPKLHTSLDEYTGSAGDQRELEGREAVYDEILGFLEELQNSGE